MNVVRMAAHAVVAAVFAFQAVAGMAATLGRDEADDSAYAKRPAWTSGENGGTGFMGWNLVGTGEPATDRGFKIADSRGINSDVNSPAGVAFGLFANGKGLAAEAYRTFDAPLDVGQTFSVDVAVNFRSGQRGLDLRAPASDNERVIFNFNVGAEDYVVHKAATGNGSVGSTYDARSAFTLTFTQTGAAGGSWTVVRRGGVASKSTGTYEGRAAGVKFYVRDTDGGKENEFWINHLAITAAGAR